MSASNFRWIVWLPALPLLLAGCATNALWQEGRFASFHEPATPSNLELFRSATKHEVLVGYDEANEQDDVIHHRFYRVNLDRAPFKNPHQPKFEPDDQAARFVPVPIFPGPVTPLFTNSFYAVSTNGQDFTLFSTTEKIGPYELPVYKDASGRVKQVLLTPVTVVADATIVGGLLFLWWWSAGGLSDVH